MHFLLNLFSKKQTFSNQKNSPFFISVTFFIFILTLVPLAHGQADEQSRIPHSQHHSLRGLKPFRQCVGQTSRNLMRGTMHVAGKLTRGCVTSIGRTSDWIAQRSMCTADSLSRCRIPGAKPLSHVFRGLGSSLKYLLGTETLKRTSLEIGGGLNFASPIKWLGGGGIGGTWWTGDIQYHDNKAKGHKYTDPEASGLILGATPVGSVSYNQLTGINLAVAPPFVNAAVGERNYNIGVNIPNVIGFGLQYVGATKEGEYARGPGISQGIGIDLLPIGPIKVVGMVGGVLYYPPLGALTDRVKQPAAWAQKKIEQGKTLIAQASTKINANLSKSFKSIQYAIPLNIPTLPVIQKALKWNGWNGKNSQNIQAQNKH